MSDNRIPVAILGATGNVGQRFIQLLQDHPWFRVAELVASERSAGKKFEDATVWRLGDDIPDAVRGLTVQDYNADLQSPLAFSSLPSDVAGDIEGRLAAGGAAVLSNTATHRMDVDVPLVIPEINPEHLDMIETQKANRGWKGFITTNSNCSTMHLALTLKPLQDAFGLKKVLVTTLQAVSGAGYPGVPSLDMIDNIVPYIPGGSTVSAPRGLVECVATEYGVAHLAGLSLRQRAEEMIRIAHPDFRAELEAYAKETF